MMIPDQVEHYQPLILTAIVQCLLSGETQYVNVKDLRFKIVPWPEGEELDSKDYRRLAKEAKSRKISDPSTYDTSRHDALIAQHWEDMRNCRRD